MTYDSTDDQAFHEEYPSPNKKVDWKKIAITGAAVGLTIAGYQYGHQQGYEEGVNSVQNQQQEEQ